MPFLDDDIVDLRLDNGKTWQLYWGDEVEVISEGASDRRVRVKGFSGSIVEGRMRKSGKLRNERLLRLSMIDVQQGDGLIIETPGNKTIFIDGGDNQLFARHAAARFAGTTEQKPLVVDLMLVTHGDADHFEGLTELRKSETNDEPRKRIFVAPKRYFHNGVVKRPGKKPDGKTRKETEMLGTTTEVAGRPFITGLVDDPAALPASERNRPFEIWTQTLASWDLRTKAVTGKEIERRRIDHRSTDAFDFLNDEEVHVELFGPISVDTPAGPGLPFMRDPSDDASLMLGTIAAGGGSWSASHTINGHSIAFRMRYRNVRFMFTGDLNQESSQRLRETFPNAAFRSEILKAPHHGSADFDMEFLKEVGPVVSMISSGDESEAKEYIHPRATLMSGLGKAARTTPGIIFCTELAAFFKTVGYVPVGDRRVFVFERTNFGIVHVRTDGERVLALTHSGKKGLNEAYRFTVDPTGKVDFAPIVSKVSAPPKTP